MDNKSAFTVDRYDENIRKVIPFYDEIYEQIFSVIQAYSGEKPLRYNQEFFPISVSDHFELLHKTGFKATELFWHTYMQSGFYSIKL